LQTVTVVARETFPYAGITRYRGERFDASVEDARILKLAQRVEDAPADPQANQDLPENTEIPSLDTEPRARRGRRRASAEETPAE
jgi:hypothetical protein